MSVTSTVKKRYDQFSGWWNRTTLVRQNRNIILALSVGWLILNILMVGIRIPIIILIPTILLVYATINFMKTWSSNIALLAIAIYVISSYATMFILVIITCYLSYIILKEHRINRLKKYAKAKPADLAALKYKKGDKPQEIVIEIKE